MAGKEEVDAAVQGYVYVLREGNGTLYKIGRALDVNERVRNLQTGNPRKLNIKQKPYEVSDYTAAENAAHKAVEDDYKANLGGGTEWYEVKDEERETFFGKIEEAVGKYPV